MQTNSPGPWTVRLVFFPRHTAPGAVSNREILYTTNRELCFDIQLELIGGIANGTIQGLPPEEGLLFFEVVGHPAGRPTLYRLGMEPGLPYASCQRKVEDTDAG